MTAQYLRKVSLTVGSAEEAIDLSDVQFSFEVLRGDLQTPNSGSFRLYNLDKQTTDQLRSGEFTAIVFQAGYESNFGIIFKGTIKYVYFGHETAIDSYVDVVAADADEAYNYAIVNGSLAAGSTSQDHIDLAAKSMEGFGVSFDTKTNPTINGNKLPRGKVFYGPARDVLRRTARDYRMTWSIQDSALNLVLQTSYRPGEPIVLTSATGMIGFPEQTVNGIKIRSLLNPAIKIGGRVQIDNDSVQRFRFGLSPTDVAAAGFIPSIDFDGMYKVLFTTHHGDTRQTEFYTEILCLAVDPSATVPPNILSQRVTTGPVPTGPVNPYKGSQ